MCKQLDGTSTFMARTKYFGTSAPRYGVEAVENTSLGGGTVRGIFLFLPAYAREQEGPESDVDGEAAALPFHLEVGELCERPKQLPFAVALRGFPFLVQGKRVRTRAHETVGFQVVTEWLGDGVLEAVVLDRAAEVELVRARVGDDRDHLAHFVSQRKEKLAVLDLYGRLRILAPGLCDEIAQLDDRFDHLAFGDNAPEFAARPPFAAGNFALDHLRCHAAAAARQSDQPLRLGDD